MNKKTHFRFNIGISSFILVFVTLCLVTFSVLTLVSANANQKLNEQVIDQVNQYYEMSNQANHKLASIDQILYQIDKQTQGEEQYFQQVYDKLSIHDRYYSFSIEGKTQRLNVRIELLSHEENQPYYKVIQWAKENTKEWTPDQQLDIYGG